ncbi:MAG: hypothetical protein ACHQRM_07035 [Bacteroidia bacterium]
MPSQRTNVRQVTVSLGLRNIPNHKLLSNAQAYTNALREKKQRYPKPTPSLRTMDKLIDEMQEALIASNLSDRMKMGLIRVARKALLIAVKQLGAYVEALANKYPDEALTYVHEAMMNDKKQTSRNKLYFAMKSGPAKGEITLTALAGRKSYSMEFQITTTPRNEDSWKTVQQKTKSSVTISGLERGTLYYGRCIRTDSSGTYQYGETDSAGVP